MFGRRTAAAAVAATLHCAILSGALGSQDLSAALERRLRSAPLVTEFSMKPSGLVLLPSYPGSADFAARHEALRPHAVQEALFALPANSLRIDPQVVYRILLEAPSLSGLKYREGGKLVPLFNAVRILEAPLPEAMKSVIEVQDRDFGTIRFQAEAEALPGRIELRMVNLDPMRYLVFPAIPPRQAMVDLVYYAGESRSLVYTAWSVRAYLFIPSAETVRKPLYYRTVALKNWFVPLLERFSE